MAKFNGTVDQIEINTNKKDTFDSANPSSTAYLSEAGVKAAIEDTAIMPDGSVPMTGTLNMDGHSINDVNNIVARHFTQKISEGNYATYPNATSIITGTKVTSISSSSTDSQIPSAKAVYDLAGRGSSQRWVEIDTESGTEESKNKITLDFSTGGTKSSYSDIVIAINVPPPPVNLSYCQAKVTLKGGGVFYANAETAIQASATKAALCYFKFNVEDGMVNYQCYTRANIGRSYAQIGDNVNPVVAGGTAGCFGMSLNYADPTDYEIAGIELLPTNNSSAFAIGTNYRVWGKE